MASNPRRINQPAGKKWTILVQTAFLALSFAAVIALIYLYYQPASFQGQAVKDNAVYKTGALATACGDGTCDPGETADNCPADCGSLELYVATYGNDAWPGTKQKPFATLERARNRIRELKALGQFTKPTTVLIRGGVYVLNRTFELDAEDSGTENLSITYAAYPQEKAIISGGKQLSLQWTKINPLDELFQGRSPNQTNSIYVANASNFVNQWEPFNSLFVDDKRAVRARSPNNGYYITAAVDSFDNRLAFYFTTGDINSSWHNLQEIEVSTFVRWEQYRERIDRIQGNKVFFQAPIQSRLPEMSYAYDYNLGHTRYYVENVLEGLDSPGEWYLDSSTKLLYYWPLPETSINASEFTAPVLNQILAVHRDDSYLPDFIQSLNNSFTIAMWIKTSYNNITSFFGARDYIVYQGYSLGFNEQGRLFITLAQNYNLTTGRKFCNSVKKVNDGTWHHFAVVVDVKNNTYQCYIDGSNESKSQLFLNNKYLNFLVPNLPPILGQILGTVDQPMPYNGSVDELLMYKKALSPEEIKCIYEKPLNGQQTCAYPVNDSLLLHLDFEEGYSSLAFGKERGNMLYSSNLEEAPGVLGKAAYFEGNLTRYLVGPPISGYPVINIRGLQFSYSDWSLPPEGHTNVWPEAGMNIKDLPAVVLEQRNSNFENNTISHIGGGYAAALLSINSSFAKNSIYDATGGGVVLGEGNITYWHSGKRDHFLQFNKITDNNIRDLNTVYKTPVGIWLLTTPHNLVSHNQIFNASWSGMYIGWYWTYLRSHMWNITVSKNDIHNVMQELNDGGGIHLVGNQPDTVISENKIHDILLTKNHVSSHVISGIYFNTGASAITVKDNAIYRIQLPGLFFNLANMSRMTNNLVLDVAIDQVWPPPPKELAAADGLFRCGNALTHNIFYFTNASANFSHNQYYNASVNESDYNLFFNPNKNLSGTLKDLQASGLDNHSLVADPLFTDYAKDNFTLKPNSPALSLGFHQINVSDAGPRNVECWSNEDCSIRGQPYQNRALFSGRACVQTVCRNSCGDGLLEANEACDDGTDNGQPGFCSTDCASPGRYCGDGVCNGNETCPICPECCTTTTDNPPGTTTTPNPPCVGCGGFTTTSTSRNTTTTTPDEQNATTSTTEPECSENQTKCVESPLGSFIFQCSGGKWMNPGECTVGCAKIGIGGACKIGTSQTLADKYNIMLAQTNALLKKAKDAGINASTEEQELDAAAYLASKEDYKAALEAVSSAKKTLLEKLAENNRKLDLESQLTIGTAGTGLLLIILAYLYVKKKREKNEPNAENK